MAKRARTTLRAVRLGHGPSARVRIPLGAGIFSTSARTHARSIGPQARPMLRTRWRNFARPTQYRKRPGEK